jgi:hypothetical protein
LKVAGSAAVHRPDALIPSRLRACANLAYKSSHAGLHSKPAQWPGKEQAMRSSGWIVLVAVMLAAAGVKAVGSARAADARPSADEECVMQCDECMARAGDDEDKAKACDDQYAECLKKCR